jgi:hypothetical protein
MLDGRIEDATPVEFQRLKNNEAEPRKGSTKNVTVFEHQTHHHISHTRISLAGWWKWGDKM